MKAVLIGALGLPFAAIVETGAYNVVSASQGIVRAPIEIGLVFIVGIVGAVVALVGILLRRWYDKFPRKPER